MVSRYVSSVPVKPEGLCLLPPPHQSHYRMIPPQRSDGAGFHVTTPPTAFVSQQGQNQPPNQGGSIRGMAPTGPPTQASTPPQTEQMKQMQQQPGQIQMYVSQTVRAGQGYHTYRTPPPNTGGPRMTHRQVPNQMYQPMPMYSTTIAQPMYHPVQTNYPNNTQRAPFYPMQTFPPMLPGQFIHGSFPAQQPQTPPAFYSPQYQQPMTMPGQRPPGPAIPTAPQGAAQAQPAVMPPPLNQPQQMRKKRDKAIPIINPNTGKNINDEDESLPTSGDNSARETPNNMQVVAEFAARVAIVASEDKMNEVPEPNNDPVIFQQPNDQSATDAANEHVRKTECIVQNSILQVSTKEFVPELKHVPKEEVTPIDSNRVEVPPPASSPIKIKAPPNKQMPPQPLPPQQPVQQQIPPVQVQQPQIQVQMQPPIQQQQMPPQIQPKEVEGGVYVNQDTVHEPQLEKVNNKVNKVVKMEQSNKNIEMHNAKESTPVDDTVADKGKRSQQKLKENTQVQTQQQIPAAATATAAAAAAAAATQKQTTSVPGSQPPKPTSKSNKMRELNMKGANKEGTDMDAFSTAENQTNENCNQAQQPPIQNVQMQKQINQQINQEIANPVIDNSAIVTNNTTTANQNKQQTNEKKPMKVDVTSIVKEVPKTIKPFNTNQQQQQPNLQNQQPIESQDETDRAVTEKLVQVKNEANIKANAAADSNDNQVIDKNIIRYKKDQWSPLNTAGKKIYDRDFLLTLKDNPKSKLKPENLPDLDVVLKDSNRSRNTDPKQLFNSFSRQPEVLMPPFTKSMSQRGTLRKTPSQQGRTSSKSGKPNAIHVTISLKDDVKLRETENAWRPARLNSAGGALTEDELKTAVLYKKVRGVLNKLTPEKFEKLLSQVQELTIDNEERLQGVIDLVFEKAVDEPNYSVAYANMCKELALMQVPVDRKKQNDPNQVEHVNFRKLLITRCQLEFEKNSIDENARIIKVKEIEECTDPEKKKELQLMLEESDRRIRMKSVGNIRFIGELFKQQMLTVNIMLKCINILLDNKDEDSLECLCKLLTTIGKDLEQAKKQNLQSYFNTMQDIVDKKHGKISSRVRFMLQDVIDLRNSKWVPRRQDLNPKTMEQIQKEADTEQLNIQVMNSSMNTPRKDDRLGGNVGSERKRGGRNNPSDDGWSMAAPRGRVPYQVESSKLMNKPPLMEELTLGSKTQFGQWGQGSKIKAQTHAPVTNTANMYAALENINSEEKTRSNYESRLKDSYVSKGPSMERSGYNKNYEDGQGSRSGSQHRNSQQRPTPSPTISMKRDQQQSQQQAPAPQPPIPQLTPHQLELKIKNIVDEYINECSNLKDTLTEVKLSIEPSKMQEFVTQGYNAVLDTTSAARLKMGVLFANLIKNNQLTFEDYKNSVVDLLSCADDLVIDIPKLWTYLAEMIVPLLTEGAFTMDRLKLCMEVLKSSKGHLLLAQLLRQLIAEKGPGYINEIWQSSGVSFTDFMPSDIVNSFIKDNKFDFMVGGAGIPVMAGSISWDNVHRKLLQFFEAKTSFDTITGWISANVGDHVKENQFIRTLVTALCENAMYESNNMKKINIDEFMKEKLLLQRYIDSNEQYELQCLYAVQALVHKWEHPPGVLLTIFEKLWEDGYVSTESLLTWEESNDPAEQEGKVLATVALQRLFTELNEPDDDSSEGA